MDFSSFYISVSDTFYWYFSLNSVVKLAFVLPYSPSFLNLWLVPGWFIISLFIANLFLISVTCLLHIL